MVNSKLQIVNSNKQMLTSLCDLFEPDEEVKFEGFRQDKVDHLQALLNSEVCEESNDEEYEEINTNQRSSKKLKRKT